MRTLRRTRGPQGRAATPSTPAALSPGRHDLWLQDVGGERLAAIEEACGRGGPERYALFRELDVDLWALLLTQEYAVLPNIRALLPAVPDPALQEVWNGVSGAVLAAQGGAFYSKLSDRFAMFGERPLAGARVLDFGCGWGRLTRFLARDVEPGRLFGCDPVQAVLDVCERCRVPAQLARSRFVPERVPFDETFDLAFAFSVFTHLSEAAHEACLAALHGALRPGAILVVTIRPLEYLRVSEHLLPVLAALGPEPAARLREARYLFAAHPADPAHPQYDGGEMTYGEAVITLPYVLERWTPRFDVLAVDLLLGDLHQVMVTLRRR